MWHVAYNPLQFVWQAMTFIVRRCCGMSCTVATVSFIALNTCDYILMSATADFTDEIGNCFVCLSIRTSRLECMECSGRMLTSRNLRRRAMFRLTTIRATNRRSHPGARSHPRISGTHEMTNEMSIATNRTGTTAYARRQ